MTETVVSKGERFNLTKETGGATDFYIGLGWESNFDLDVSVFGLEANGKLVDDNHFIYFDKNHLRTPNGSIVHSGDKLNGDAPGDDEQVRVKLNLLDPRVEELSIVVNVYGAPGNGQNFGQVRKAHVQVAQMDGNGQPALKPDGNVDALVRYPLSDDFSKFTAVHVGSIYKRDDGGWAFNPTGDGFENADLGVVLQHYT